MAFPHYRRHLPVHRTQLHSKEHAMRAWEGNKGGRSLGRARGQHCYCPGHQAPAGAY